MPLRIVPAILLVLLLVVAGGAIRWWMTGDESPPPAFAGSAACAGCHAAEYAAWERSQHALAMQPASQAAMLGRFTGDSLSFDGQATRFHQQDGRYFVDASGADGKAATFELRYSFGLYPLQQYLVPLPGGRLQAFGIAWDSRPAAAGGQRWFDLYPDQKLLPGQPLHWTGIDQAWNYQCADCHSTDLRKNYDAATRSYASKWSEISVGCEACHGPASNHVSWAQQGRLRRARDPARGLVVALDERQGVSWNRGEGPTAARSVPATTSREIGVCARCHARRGQFTDTVNAGSDWLDGFRPALIEPGLYHVDGQQREEVYTWGSFMQSRMHAAGVSCADCHEPHSGSLRAAGNAVCAQCHAPATFDASSHHHHEPGSPGSRCVACHMPATTYMVVDPRHDHSLRIPRPDQSVSLGTPNACGNCHDGHDARWAAAAIAGWYPQRKPGFQAFAATFAAADRGDPAADAALAALVTDAAQPAIVRASAIARGARSGGPQWQAASVAALGDGDALVRTAAAEGLRSADPALRAEQLPKLLADPVRLVRMAAARSLAGAAESRLVGSEVQQFKAALAEWTAAQQFNADRPEAMLNLGSLHLERGDADGALAAFRDALVLDPAFVQAAVNLADVQRATGDEAGAERSLRAALSQDPASAVVHHALGLSLVRQGRTREALPELRMAHENAPGDARFAYVYAVALHDSGDVAGAIRTLQDALRGNPYDRDIREALAAYGAR